MVHPPFIHHRYDLENIYVGTVRPALPGNIVGTPSIVSLLALNNGSLSLRPYERHVYSAAIVSIPRYR